MGSKAFSMTDFVPTMTFPDDIADAVRSNYNTASSILEYGSGGSTALASMRNDVTCFSVESDPVWASKMKRWLAEHGNGQTHIHFAGIGQTKAWGYPLNYSQDDLQKYRRYTRSVWQRADFIRPDVILIDGRFRLWCFLTVMARIRKPTRILFDDYKNRSHYHYVEQYFEPVEMVGRMAIFDITRTPFRLRDMDDDTIKLVTKPQ